MSQILLAIEGPSPNVGSGATAPYGIATNSIDGVDGNGTGSNGLGTVPPNTAGTRKSLSTSGIAGGTFTDNTVQVIPSTIPVPAISPSSPNVNCGKPGAFAGVASTTIPAEPSQG